MGDQDNSIVINITGNTDDVEAAFKKLGTLFDQAGKKSKAAGEKSGGFFDTIEGFFKGGIFTEMNQGIELAKKFEDKIIDTAKALVDLVLHAEDIKAINVQFDLLAKNAHLSGDALKEGLIAASGGLADTEDLLQAASNSLVGLGSRAKELPQLFELARKSAVVFGGTAIERFESLSVAIQNGNVKQLKAQGIVVDVDRVYKDYAKTLGLMSTELTTGEKQQALLNATLAKGEVAFQGIDESTRKTQTTLQQMSVSFKELGDTGSEIFSKTFGSLTNELIKNTNLSIKEFDATLRETFLGQTQKSADALYLLQQRLEQFQARAEAFSKSTGGQADAGLNEQITLLQQQIQLIEKKQTLEAGGSGTGPANLDPDAVKAAYRKQTDAQIEAHAEQDDETKARNARLLQEQTAFQAELGAVKDGELLEQENRQLQLDANEQIFYADNLSKVQAFEQQKLQLQFEAQRQKLLATEDSRKKTQALQLLDANQSKQFEELKTKQALEQQTQREENFKSTLGTIATLQASGSEELFAIGKAAAVATATIDGIAAVQKALAAAPPPINFVLAGVVGVAAAINVANIASSQPPKKYAQGGMITGGIPGVDSVPLIGQQGEIVAPTKSFDEVVEGTARSRGFVKGDENASLESLLEQILEAVSSRPALVFNGQLTNSEQFINWVAEQLREAVQTRGAQLS